MALDLVNILLRAPSVAIQNLLSGKPEWAIRAFLDPDSLPDWADQTLGEKIHAGPVWRFFIDTMTNPLFLVGLAMSRHFPVLKFGEDVIPPRLSVQAGDVGLFGRMFRTFGGLLGTEIESLNTQALTRKLLIERDFAERYHNIRKQFDVKAWNEHHRYVIAQLLDGQIVPASIEERLAADRIRELFNELADLQQIPIVRRLRSYLPHVLPRSDRTDFVEVEIERLMDELTKNPRFIDTANRSGISPRQLFNKMFRNDGRFVRNVDLELILRSDVRDYVNPFLLPRTANFPGYTLNLDAIFGTYLRRAARTFAYKVPAPKSRFNPEGIPILNRLDELASQIPPTSSRLQIYKEFKQAIVGRMGLMEYYTAASWANLVDKLRPLAEKLPDGYMKRRIMEFLARTSGTFGFREMTNMVASWFYSSTLGLNVGSAIRNLLQTPITTVPEIGPSYTLKGIAEVGKRLLRYRSLRKAGMPREEAYRHVFKDYLATGVDAGRSVLEYAEAYGATSLQYGVSRRVEEWTEWTLLPFTFAERANRLIAFYGGKAKALAEGLSEEQAARLAGEVVARTQWIADPTTTTPFLRQMPALLRQFTSFPIRWTNWLIDSTARGAPIEPQPGRIFGGRRWGAIGRLLSAQAVVYELGKSLGLDLSMGLTPGVIPTGPADMPFSPLPLPPILSLGIGGAMSILDKDKRHLLLERVIPTMAPGGIAISRAMRIHNHQLDDIEIDDYGRAIRKRPPLQALLEAVGIPTIKRADALRRVRKILAARQDYTALRREMLAAILYNDEQRLHNAINTYLQRFPEAPLPRFRPADIALSLLRWNQTRLARMLATAPSNLKPMFVIADEYDGLRSPSDDDPLNMLIPRIDPFQF